MLTSLLKVFELLFGRCEACGQESSPERLRNLCLVALHFELVGVGPLDGVCVIRVIGDGVDCGSQAVKDLTPVEQLRYLGLEVGFVEVLLLTISKKIDKCLVIHGISWTSLSYSSIILFITILPHFFH